MSKNKAGPQNRQFASALLVLEFQMPHFGSNIQTNTSVQAVTKMSISDLDYIKEETKYHFYLSICIRYNFV